MRKFMSIRNRIRSNSISICHCEEYVYRWAKLQQFYISSYPAGITIAWEHSTVGGAMLRLVTTSVIFIHFIISITYSRIYYTVYTLKRDRCSE